ncbi:MAG: hypothetical protein ACKVY0_13315 [Prosthecobacter sp.]|uniref:hypothetical protein n=1 Tax=Prosthecobacter sp. TaxID=1965333 RepID=UPI0039016E35
MKISKSTTTLLLLNLVWMGAVAYLVKRLADAQNAAAPVPAASVPAAPEVRVEKRIVTVTRTNDFHWSQLESEDYRAYIERLRSIGCPEQTIRDIIIADVDKLLAPRLRAAAPGRKDLAYWQSEEKELWSSLDQRESHRQQQAIDFEKRNVIQQLMGVDLVAERQKVLGQEDYYGKRLDFLPDGKRSRVRIAVEKAAGEELAVRQKVWEEGEALTAGDQAQLRQIQKQRDAEIAATLSPEEFRQYELRMSPTAYSVRDSLFGMNATEEEFLEIFKLRKGFDDVWGQGEPEDPAAQEKWAQSGEALQAAIRAKLGEARAAEYVRAQDADYRGLCVAAARFQLPASKALEVYDYKRQVQEQRVALASNPTLTLAQKTAALQAMGDETEQAVREAMGERAFRYYQRQGLGGWMRK